MVVLARAGLRRTLVLSAVAFAGGHATPTPAQAATKQPRFAADATVVSVDGPGELTLRTKGGRFPMRLALLDVPHAGECGAPQSTEALRRLTGGRRARVRYVLGAKRPDPDGRYPAFIGPRKADLTERSLAQDLLTREWARTGATVEVSEADNIWLSAGSEPTGPRPARGLWAACGGATHLPATETPPPHAPATWTITPDGLTTAIGPITLPAVLAPGTLPTVAALRQHLRVETSPVDERVCRARIASLELTTWTNTMGPATCDDGEIFAFSTSGPGAAQTTSGLRVGGPSSDAPKLFPRVAASQRGDADLGRQISLVGDTPTTWAWATQAIANDRTDTITALLTRTSRFER